MVVAGFFVGIPSFVVIFAANRDVIMAVFQQSSFSSIRPRHEEKQIFFPYQDHKMAIAYQTFRFCLPFLILPRALL